MKSVQLYKHLSTLAGQLNHLALDVYNDKIENAEAQAKAADHLRRAAGIFGLTVSAAAPPDEAA